MTQIVEHPIQECIGIAADEGYSEISEQATVELARLAAAETSLERWKTECDQQTARKTEWWLEASSRGEHLTAALARVETLEQERDQAVGRMEAWKGIAERAQRGIRLAGEFGDAVLLCDIYGCENGPDECLHADARRFLDSLAALSAGEQEAK